MSNRSSPARKIESVARLGNHGSVRYMHLLECGHTITRPRREAGVIRCIKCLEPPSDFHDEAEVRTCQLNLASSLGVSPDEVTINVDASGGPIRLSGAVVWLDSASVRRLIQRGYKPKGRPPRSG